MKKSALIFASLLTIAACSNKPTQLDQAVMPEKGGVPDVSQAYDTLIERYSDGDSKYSGFYNNFEYKATLQNSTVREAVLLKKANYYLWPADKVQTERQKLMKEMAEETEIFVSFFTPDRKNDNLSEEKAIWRVYLEAGGRRYQGKARKVKSLLAELQTLYPYHNRWTTPYELKFAIPTSVIETQESTLTITGPLGSRTVRFLPVK